MERKHLIDGCVEYFRSRQWKDVVQILQERDMNHFHVYLDTSLHPWDSLGRILTGYLAARGWQVYREIQRQSPRPGIFALYGVNLPDKAHFDLFLRYNPDVIIAPMPPLLAERGGNVRVWWDRDIRRFQELFDWRTLSRREEAEVGDFFESGRHWQQFCDLVLDTDIVHVHCNIETSVHPNELRKYALHNLTKRGWKIAHAIHSLFNAGGADSGKIIFLGLQPERTYDIGWYFSPSVLIQANTQDTRMTGHEGTGREFYVLRWSESQRELAKNRWVDLSDMEVELIVKATSTFDHKSAYSWRVISEH
jgi:hypothetical protein